MRPIDLADLDLVLEHTRELWPGFAGKRLYITGGTGFVGSWLVQTFEHANRVLRLGAEVQAIGSPLRWPSGHWDALIHAAPVATTIPTFDRVLLISSGAAYEQETEYACMKRTAEMLAGKSAVIARLFTFIGPGLKDRYAVTSFLRDGLAGGPIRVTGSGLTVRSYLYAADMAIRLWHLLFRGFPGVVYDVGSSRPTSIHELSRLVAAEFNCAVKTEYDPCDESRTTMYLPEMPAPFGLPQVVNLRDAIAFTAAWERGRKAMSAK